MSRLTGCTAPPAMWLWIALLAASNPDRILAQPAAEAQEAPRRGPAERSRLGTWGHWTGYVIRDGELRQCFAETKPIGPAEGAALQADLPVLQLTHRSAGRQAHWVRLAPNSEGYALFLGARVLGHLGGGWNSKGLEFLNQLLANEAAGTALSIRDDYDTLTGALTSEAKGTVLGRYSLQGIGDAYAAIRKECPGRETPTDILVSGEVVRVQPYVELALSGPFAEAGRNERFSVRFFPDEWAEEDDFPKKLPTNSGAVPYLRNVARSEYLRRGTSLGEVGGAYHLDFLGICRDPGSERIKTVFKSWQGGASTAASTSTVEFDPDEGLVVTFLSDTESGYGNLDCFPGERLWKEGGEDFRPCSCDHAYLARLADLVQDLEQAAELSGPGAGVGEKELAGLLARVERISPFLDWDGGTVQEWDVGTTLEVDEFTSSEYSLVVVTYSSGILYWSSFQYLFGRRNSDDVWELLYDAPLSSRAFQKVDIQGFIGAEILELEMCCTSRGRHATVRIDVGQWLESIGRQEEDFLESVLARAIAEADAASEAAEAAERRQREAEAANASRAAAAAQAEAAAARKDEMARVAAELAALAPGMEMVVIPAGSFRMGCLSHFGCDSSERPRHRVKISRAFTVSKDEVTFAQWDACVSSGGCSHEPDDEGWGRSRRPVVNVSWVDAQRYVAWLSGETGAEYRLLTEAEWEYAVRAGSTSSYSWGEGEASGLANCADCGTEWGGSRTAPVGSFAANNWGLHDIHGNVWEWVQDCWNDNYVGAPSDGGAWEQEECSRRVLRGGAWNSHSSWLGSASRGGEASDLRGFNGGFRVARTLAP